MIEFMAPEFFTKAEYKPQEADLFAAGVILFIMRVKKQPFKKACSTDPLYKYFITGEIS